jgi:hypothetical protein
MIVRLWERSYESGRNNMKYSDDVNLSYTNEAPAPASSVSSAKQENKAKSKQSGKNNKAKNSEVHFSSDEEIEEIKNITLNDIDFSNPMNYTAKHLLENPEDLEDLDIKQYYHNPVRCCFDNPTLAFTPMCFL